MRTYLGKYWSKLNRLKMLFILIKLIIRFDPRELEEIARKKFDKGRKEHGENFEAIDYESEIKQELADTFNYYGMNQKCQKQNQ